MDILHITPSSNGYEEVKLIANRINKKNHWAYIERNGENLMTGGFLIKDTPKMREILDAIPKDKQYDFIKMIREVPFEKDYLEKD